MRNTERRSRLDAQRSPEVTALYDCTRDPKKIGRLNGSFLDGHRGFIEHQDDVVVVPDTVLNPQIEICHTPVIHFLYGLSPIWMLSGVNEPKFSALLDTDDVLTEFRLGHR